MKEVKESMAEKNNSALFYTCSLIEYIGRTVRKERSRLVKEMGRDAIEQIYEYADIFHCEPIEKVAYEWIEECGIEQGKFDNVAECKYTIPDYWTIGAVFERVIEDNYDEDKIVDGIMEVYTSWMEAHLSDYNTDFYYQSRNYLAACYKAGEVLE